MATDKKPTPSKNKSISINGDVSDSNVIIGDNATVNQTIIQKFFNIFKSDSETLEQRNRRILLNHVENAWIKGVLDASLHGAALLDLGIKEDPEAVTKYPWAIKKESIDETLPAGTSMLEIFDSIGMGRSLLILGTPGSGKTTMLLELARQLIARAREDVTYPIPMVFNLASWTEKLTLADWLAQELNNLYSVPRKTAPDWIKGNKLLLLLDGLDEVRQDCRAKCVEAINEFRKQNGLTSLAVCSRSQDYADLNTKLSFEGAIEVQSLTQKQITEFFNRFGKEMAGIKQVLKKDNALREMAETPLFLSIMIMAYRDKRDVDILVSRDEKARRKHLFDTYIERMFERRTEIILFKKTVILHWLSWLASKMIKHNQVPYLLEDMQPKLLNQKFQGLYRMIVRLDLGLLTGPIIGASFLGLIGEFTPGIIVGLIVGLIFSLSVNQTSNMMYIEKTLYFSIKKFVVIFLLFGFIFTLIESLSGAITDGVFFGLLSGVVGGFISGTIGGLDEIKMVDTLTWNWRRGGIGVLLGICVGLIGGLVLGLGVGLVIGLSNWLSNGVDVGLLFGLIFALIVGLLNGLNMVPISRTIYPGQRISFSYKNSLFVFLLTGLVVGVVLGLLYRQFNGHGVEGIIYGLIFGLVFGLRLGGLALIQHYSLRFILARNNLLPWRLVPFLDHCVDLIFLRRVGGGYIFIHRLLMEHFAEMYVETPTSKGN